MNSKGLFFDLLIKKIKSNGLDLVFLLCFWVQLQLQTSEVKFWCNRQRALPLRYGRTTPVVLATLLTQLA
jgi:hypothetical protein